MGAVNLDSVGDVGQTSALLESGDSDSTLGVG